jgi:hypothetical protein
MKIDLLFNIFGITNHYNLIINGGSTQQLETMGFSAVAGIEFPAHVVNVTVCNL